VVAAMPAVRWNCPTCKVVVTTPFCARCGEEPLPPRDLTWSEFAQSVVAQRLAATNMTAEQYEVIFDRAAVLNAKSLILLMTLPFALILPLSFWRERQPFMTHVVFSLHLYTFLLLLFCAALLAAKVSALLGFGGLDAPNVDTVLSVVNVLVCTLRVYWRSVRSTASPVPAG